VPDVMPEEVRQTIGNLGDHSLVLSVTPGSKTNLSLTLSYPPREAEAGPAETAFRGLAEAEPSRGGIADAEQRIQGNRYEASTPR
jgi:hypothetical protein